jgi:putative ATP-grasp target RiPP
MKQEMDRRHTMNGHHAIGGGVDAVCSVAAMFSLGRPFGLLPDTTTGDVCAADVLPFGLGRAVVTLAVPVGDLSAYGYDPVRQIGTVADGGQVVPLWKHTTGQTRSVTHPDGRKGPDSDTDQRQD